ncbi:MAG: lipid IV(A) 3-deoxy-D-manno-octulosonic acid transferase [Burkholderiales bacterium]|nr:lipid IV(A) 3-deoxy-D-manno-octulosonic acid transferase [Burkholderiales bacterium]
MVTPGRLARAAYALVLRLALPLYFARLWWRGRREPEYRRHWRERLGGGTGRQPPGRLWIHAVSLGEARAAAPLVQALRAQRPALALLLTHGTATGRDAGRALLQAGDAQAWLPYDTPGAVRRFLRRHRPCTGVLLETEVWPALLHAAQRAGVPMVLANARLSARSQARGQRLAALMRPAVAAIDAVLAQTAADAERLRALGAREVQVLGNLKFDMTPPPALLAQGGAWRAALGRAVVLAAATREGEAAPLLQAWAALPGPRPLLLVVPRHPQRFDEVAALVPQAGLTAWRRSAWGHAGSPAAAARDVDVWLGDSIGEMPLYYALADVALLGGSFAPLGGQNLIEAAACGCPLLMGPHTYNFAQAAELALAAGAAERCADLAAAVRRAVEVAADPARAAWSARALAFAAEHRGAAARMAAAVLAVAERPKAER